MSSSTTSTSSSQQPALLKTAEILPPPSGTHKSTIIWTHGLGDSSQGFSGMFRQLQQSPPANLQNTRVVLPNAPVQPVSVNGGMRMRSWYDIYALGAGRGIDSKEDAAGITESCRQLTELLDYECQKVGSENVIIGGFSQGAALSLFTGLQYKRKLAGIISTSGYLLLNSKYPDIMSEYARQIPILAYHGELDEVVPYHLAVKSYDILRKNGVNSNLEFHSEKIPHTLSDKELQTIVKWWREKLK